MSKFGRSAISWTSTEDANTQRVHLLDAPLFEVSPAHTMPVYYAESLDRTVQEYNTVGTGSYELLGMVRYDPNSQSLLDMLKAGSQGKTLTYYPNLVDPDDRENVKLVAPLSPTGVGLDSQTGMRADGQVQIRFRRTDQKALTPRTRGTDVLFVYRAGDSLKDATFSRDTNSTAPATYPTLSSGDGGYGTLSTAGDEKARLAWFSSASTSGPRMLPGLLLEPSRTNFLTRSNDLNTLWSGAAATSSGQGDPAGGSVGWKVTDSATSDSEVQTSSAMTLTAATNAVVSCWLKDNDASTLRHDFILRQSTDAAKVAAVQVTFSSGVPSLTYTGVEANPPEQYRDGWWRCAARTTAAVSTSITYECLINPCGTGAGATGSVLFYGGQVEV